MASFLSNPPRHSSPRRSFPFTLLMGVAVGSLLGFSAVFSFESLRRPSDVDPHSPFPPSHYGASRVLQRAQNIPSTEDPNDSNEENKKKNGNENNREEKKGGFKFLLVSGERATPCKTAEGSTVIMKSLKNKIDYCNIHNCRVWYALESWSAGMEGTWARYPILLKLMHSKPDIQWFMWMDSDAIFTDLNFSIPFDLYESWDKNMVIPGFWDKVYRPDPDWMGVNAGVFLVRNTGWSRQFMQKWMEMGLPENLKESKEKIDSAVRRPKEWGVDDQSALVYLLSRNKSESEGNIFLEAGYSLHGYFEFIVDKYEEMLEGRIKRPFVTHFCGCNFCRGASMTERCMKGFQRAYHFADDQLLSSVRFRHLNLSEPSVQSF